jgi:predicted nucleic acid-binding protein
MILADTSVWVDHLRRANPVMIELLTANDILAHPFVIGELACGTLPDRSVLQRLDDLPQIVSATHDEVLSLIESHRFMGRGIGFIDAHLLTSVVSQSGVSLWTRDQRLKRIAEEMGVAYPESPL